MDEVSRTPGSPSCVAYCLGCFCLPITLLCSCYAVNEREEIVALSFGKYIGTDKTPGLKFRNIWGRELKKIPTAKIAAHLPVTKVVDRNGNPLLVSGVIVYLFVNTEKAALDVVNAQQFVYDQAQAIMKQIVSRYPYEPDDENDHESMSLKTESSEIGKQFVKLLQKQVHVAGAKIISFQFNELSYAPEIAMGMLKKQQAKALVSARKTIVDGAVDISHGAIVELEEKGVSMQPEDKTRLVSNLLLVICSDAEAKTSVPVMTQQ
eukprot:TRINITY_DN11582_c0_g1_i1.p1 TRINITY_DN11582_c0_g1~~TRINITY_DN11582_c0_g1_i1.p1  ORF type:complete len:264 (-),score=40.12 TRINITY_DN11582_c0_g1_i1:24-815(-)